MTITLRARGTTFGVDERFTARIATSPIADARSRKDYVLVIAGTSPPVQSEELQGYAGIILTEAGADTVRTADDVPVTMLKTVDHLKHGHIVTIEPPTGFVITVFRPESRHNTIFTTERCNSNCLMCSQPPKDVDDSFRIQEHLKTISLIQAPPEFLCITGGEPTLLGDDLLILLDRLKTQLPSTNVQMLTNGRRYADADFAKSVGSVAHPKLISAIPLYADVAGVHDYIVQAEGAFDQTVEGLYNAVNTGLTTEIRVVLHKQSVPRLRQLAEFIYRNFPFTAHVALMGLENMGYVKRNWDVLWIDPVDYMEELTDVVRYLWMRRMTVSIYNLQLCLLPRSLWSFSRRSISDFKNIYIDECERCIVRDDCAGLFASQLHRHSAHIRALPRDARPT